jgi:hypothetical protein
VIKVVFFVFTKKKIDSVISKGIKQTIKEKNEFNQNYSRVSGRIAAGKNQMNDRAQRRDLIRNK